jgi:hypothetical protein
MSLDTSPGPIMAEIVKAAAALDECGRELHLAIMDDAEARLAYDRKVEEAKIEVYNNSKKMGERPPAEDIRTALAHRMAEDEYAGHLKAKARVEALRAWQQSLRASTSARQTLLSTLKAESMFEPPYTPSAR